MKTTPLSWTANVNNINFNTRLKIRLQHYIFSHVRKVQKGLCISQSAPTTSTLNVAAKSKHTDCHFFLKNSQHQLLQPWMLHQNCILTTFTMMKLLSSAITSSMESGENKNCIRTSFSLIQYAVINFLGLVWIANHINNNKTDSDGAAAQCSHEFSQLLCYRKYSW